MLEFINETDLIFENIHDMRMLLTEAASQGDIIDAIKNHKIVYIEYNDPDDPKGSGYRTIEPYLLGVSIHGKPSIRAYQQAGSSWSFSTRKRKIFGNPKKLGPARREHEYFYDKSTVRPGWREFRVDKIVSFTPTGKYFSTAPDKIRPLYNPNDKGMSSIIAAVQPGNVDMTQIIPSAGTIQQLPTGQTGNMAGGPTGGPTGGPEGGAFKNIQQVAFKQKEINKDIIDRLYNLVLYQYKKKSSDMIVVNRDGDIVLDYEKNRGKYQPGNVLGNLKDLYFNYNPAKDKTGKAKNFFDNDKKSFFK